MKGGRGKGGKGARASAHGWADEAASPHPCVFGRPQAQLGMVGGASKPTGGGARSRDPWSGRRAGAQKCAG